MRVAVKSHALPVYKKNRIASLLFIFETIIIFIVTHSFSEIIYFELFTYILPMVTLKSGIILDQNDRGPLKWVKGPFPIQIHANYIILIGLLNFDGPKNP